MNLEQSLREWCTRMAMAWAVAAFASSLTSAPPAVPRLSNCGTSASQTWTVAPTSSGNGTSTIAVGTRLLCALTLQLDPRSAMIERVPLYYRTMAMRVGFEQPLSEQSACICWPRALLSCSPLQPCTPQHQFLVQSQSVYSRRNLSPSAPCVPCHATSARFLPEFTCAHTRLYI